jgi:RHS repeat-associated protein
VQASPAAAVHFIHDRMGNVIAETAGGGATGTTGTTREFLYLYETEIAPTMSSRTVVDRPLAVISAVNTATPATNWVSVDHLNRPVKMTSNTKASVWDAVWQPWGDGHSVTGSATLDARLPGQWFQTETGLHYNWHRSYDPTLGRHTQPDPLGVVDGPSVYGYAGGSPLRYVDMDGLWWTGPKWVPPTLPLPYPIPPHGGPLSPGPPSLPEPDFPGIDETPLPGSDGDLQRDLEHDRYKWYCETKRIPPGENRCVELQHEIHRFKVCIKLRKSWDKKWNQPDRHDDNRDMGRGMNNLLKEWRENCDPLWLSQCPVGR